MPNTRSMQKHLLLIPVLLAALLVRSYRLENRTLLPSEASLANRLPKERPTELQQNIKARGGKYCYGEEVTVKFLSVWIRITSWGDRSLRMLGVLCSLIAVALSYAITYELVGCATRAGPAAASVAICGAVLVALSPLQVVNSRQVSGFALASVLMLSALWALVRATVAAKEVSPGRWLLWLIAVVILAGFHRTAASFAFVQCILMVGLLAADRLFGGGVVRSDDGQRQRITILLTFSVLVAILSFIHFSRSTAEFAECRPVPESNESRTDTAIQVMHKGICSSWYEATVARTLLPLISTGILTIAAFVVVLRMPRPGLILVLTGLTPVLSGLVHRDMLKEPSLYWMAISLAQYAWIVAFCIAAVGTDKKSFTVRAAGVLALASTLFVTNWDTVYSNAINGGRGAAMYLLRNSDDSDLVITLDGPTFSVMNYYLTPSREVRAVPISANMSGTTDEFKRLQVIRTRLAQTGSRRVWIVAEKAAYRAFEAPPSWTYMDRQHFKRDLQWLPPITVLLYRTNQHLRALAGDGRPVFVDAADEMESTEGGDD